jgi:hypothetical protein
MPPDEPQTKMQLAIGLSLNGSTPNSSRPKGNGLIGVILGQILSSQSFDFVYWAWEWRSLSQVKCIS